MTRTKLNFEAKMGAAVWYLRMVADEPCFHLVDRASGRRLKIQKLTLHIDFMRAELYPEDTGLRARGLGTVEFGAGGPQIVDRRVRADGEALFGFVFDMASPYITDEVPQRLRSHVVGSTLHTAMQTLRGAYDAYLNYIDEYAPKIGGVPVARDVAYIVPVFDVIGWEKLPLPSSRSNTSEEVNYMPRLQLVGVVNHIDAPLTAEARQRFNGSAREVAIPIQDSPTRGGLPDETGGRRAKGPDRIPSRAYRPRLG